ncbi:TrbC/VirB2 family protein [Halomonas sp. 3A7M]|uniref:TrbC/VirB2 family protein n=1 Tax=Halomonas sp. 3A7M TaxID=2742616 RepID=UPI00186698F1|nr:TrbC/VirB2 family protein [Halomonas sp. 3A7M]
MMLIKATRFTLTFAVLALLMASPAFAQVDTASSGLGALETWITTWIPLAATLAVIVIGLGLCFGMGRMDIALRVALGLIIIGSASYIVGLFI